MGKARAVLLAQMVRGTNAVHAISAVAAGGGGGPQDSGLVQLGLKLFNI